MRCSCSHTCSISGPGIVRSCGCLPSGFPLSRPPGSIGCATISTTSSPAPSLSSRSLLIQSECTITTAEDPPFDFLVRDYAARFPFEYEPLHRSNLSLYLCSPTEPNRTAIEQWLGQVFTSAPGETVAWLFELNACISRNLRYQRRDELGMQSPAQTIERGSGSCRDFAVLFIDCARSRNLAARFVSGYLFDPLANDTQTGDMHAWVEVFLPGAGWRGLDPTNGVFCHSGYVPVAHAVVAESVNPIQGSFTSEVPAIAELNLRLNVREDINAIF